MTEHYVAEKTLCQTAAGQILCQYVARIERLREEIKALNHDVSEVYHEAKSAGYDVKALKVVIAERAKDPRDVEELAEIVDLYRGILLGTEEPRARAREDTSPTRKMVAARKEVFDELERNGKLSPTDTSQTVYFLRAPELGLIKIGSTNNLPNRIRGLSLSSPAHLDLLGTCSGGRRREILIHDQFSFCREHGEWFREDPLLLSFIENVSGENAIACTHEAAE